jgi:glucose-1-phosphate thymidylyltransferase
LATRLQRTATTNGATVFGYAVNDPERYGVVVRCAGRAITRREAGEAAIAIRRHRPYFYDNQVLDLAASLKPSKRGNWRSPTNRCTSRRASSTS